MVQRIVRRASLALQIGLDSGRLVLRRHGALSRGMGVETRHVCTCARQPGSAAAERRSVEDGKCANK